MKHGQNIKNLKILLFCLLFIFLLSNLISSQLISPLYSQIVAENKNSAVLYLQKIRTLPIFDQELQKYKSIYGGAIEDDVFRPELQQNSKIRSLRLALERNSKSRDVLYSLYLLYKEKGDEKTANNYFKRALELDPNIVK